MSIAYLPADAAVAINDMLDCCAVVKPGQNVLILAAVDGLHGGRNLVDEQNRLIQSECGARILACWVDMPSWPKVIGPIFRHWRLPGRFCRSSGSDESRSADQSHQRSLVGRTPRNFPSSSGS
jgi:hypothetical protein